MEPSISIFMIRRALEKPQKISAVFQKFPVIGTELQDKLHMPKQAAEKRFRLQGCVGMPLMKQMRRQAEPADIIELLTDAPPICPAGLRMLVHEDPRHKLSRAAPGDHRLSLVQDKTVFFEEAAHHTDQHVRGEIAGKCQVVAVAGIGDAMRIAKVCNLSVQGQKYQIGEQRTGGRTLRKDVVQRGKTGEEKAQHTVVVAGGLSGICRIFFYMRSYFGVAAQRAVDCPKDRREVNAAEKSPGCPA